MDNLYLCKHDLIPAQGAGVFQLCFILVTALMVYIYILIAVQSDQHFVIRSLDSNIVKFALCQISILQLVFVAEQA